MPTKQIKVVDEVKGALSLMAKDFGFVLPDNVSAKKFVRVCQTAVQTNPKLISANRTSLWAACMQAAESGLLPDGRNAALVAYGPNVQFIPMIAGIKSKIREGGEIKKWQLQVVYENDEFDWEEGDNDHIYHKPVLTNRGSIVAAYSIVTYKDGEKDHDVMNVDDINKHRAKAKTQNVWNEWYEEMCKKTVAKHHAKNLPLEDSVFKAVQAETEIVEAEFKEHTNKPKPEKKDTSSKLSEAVNEKQQEDPPQTTQDRAPVEEVPI